MSIDIVPIHTSNYHPETIETVPSLISIDLLLFDKEYVSEFMVCQSFRNRIFSVLMKTISAPQIANTYTGI